MQLHLFSKAKKAFGLEISDFSIKALRLQKKGQRFIIASYNRVRLPKGLVVDGEIKKENELATIISQLVEQAKPQKITTPYVVSSLPENKTYVSTVSIPDMPKDELGEAIKWEAENHIPLSISDAYLGWQVIAKEGNKISVMLAAAPKKFIDSYLNVFQLAKLKPQALEPEAVAEGRALIPEDESNIPCLIVDIGATKTTFSVLSNEIIYFSSSISRISGNFFTDTIIKNLNIKKSEAEKIKVACCSPHISEKERELLDSVHPAFDELAKEITKIQEYFYNNFEAPKTTMNIILCGGGAGLFGIAPYLSLKLKQKVRLGDPWTNVPLAKHSPIVLAEALGYTQVIGLALRGANLDSYKNHDHS